MSVANKTYPVAQAVKAIGAPSERWYVERLRDGRLPGRKIGRHWRLTDAGYRRRPRILKNDPHVTDAPTGLTPRSTRVTTT